MKISRVFPVAVAALALSVSALAQTAGTPVPTPRPAVAASVAPVVVARPSSGVAPSVVAVAQPAVAASAAASTGELQAPPAPPTPPAAPAAPQAPQAPRAPRAPRATTGEAPEPAPAAAPRNRGQLVNLRLEFTVTDQIGAAPPVKKTITMNVADGENGRIRTNAEVFRKNTAPTMVPLSVDAFPEIDGGKIRLRASLEYQLLKDAPEPDMPAGKTSITQSVTAILNDGVSAVLSQSADPLTDRKVTLEVKATIVR
jgi:hypothetical protein